MSTLPSQKAAVIESTVSITQTKLLDTVTDIARPKQETTEEIITRELLPNLLKDPKMSAVMRQRLMESIRESGKPE